MKFKMKLKMQLKMKMKMKMINAKMKSYTRINVSFEVTQSVKVKLSV